MIGIASTERTSRSAATAERKDQASNTGRTVRKHRKCRGQGKTLWPSQPRTTRNLDTSDSLPRPAPEIFDALIGPPYLRSTIESRKRDRKRPLVNSKWNLAVSGQNALRSLRVPLRTRLEVCVMTAPDHATWRFKTGLTDVVRMHYDRREIDKANISTLGGFNKAVLKIDPHPKQVTARGIELETTA
jgi:hypothetical protein